MIKADKGIVQIEGATPTVCADLSGIVRAVYEVLSEQYDDDFAREMIAKAGQIAFMSDEEMDKAVEEKKKELEELVKNYEQE